MLFMGPQLRDHNILDTWFKLELIELYHADGIFCRHMVHHRVHTQLFPPTPSLPLAPSFSPSLPPLSLPPTSLCLCFFSLILQATNLFLVSCSQDPKLSEPDVKGGGLERSVLLFHHDDVHSSCQVGRIHVVVEVLTRRNEASSCAANFT